VAKFSDFMVRDEKTQDCYRADKILEDAMDKLLDDQKNPPSAQTRAELLRVRTEAGAMKAEALHTYLSKYNVKAPDTGNNISEPQPYNLMFKTSIGPTGKFTGYLRPETAQGIFVNFRRLLDYNQGRIPFAAAQIGLAFRNEIAPRAGLLRVREFTLAEIEHFVNPENKKHPKFKVSFTEIMGQMSPSIAVAGNCCD
jgi:glycyl-tRNA synthetase